MRRGLGTKAIAPLLGIAAALIIFAVGQLTPIIERIELRLLDIHFNLRQQLQLRNIQEGVTQAARDPRISPDILIVGVDFSTLSRLGKWPFPRSRHADLIRSFTRIREQSERERALYLDFFFVEPSNAFEDIQLIESIKENERVFLETIIDPNEPVADNAAELFERHEILFNRQTRVTNISGDWTKLPPNYGLQPPLQPFAAAGAGFGHANLRDDIDEIFRRQSLILKLSRLVEIIPLDALTIDTPVDFVHFERLAWFDRNGFEHTVPYPLTEPQLEEVKADIMARAPQFASAQDNDGDPDNFYFAVRRFQDQFVPSIALALALHYFNVTPNEIEVVLGEYIRIPAPHYFDGRRWQPYRLIQRPARYNRRGELVAEATYRVIEEIRIPIDTNANMLINFMGVRSSPTRDGHQTYPVRPYAGYATRVPSVVEDEWPRTLAATNNVVMVGAFAPGIADDEKTTPYGLMYGVEIHANALNTIIMDNFLHDTPAWVGALILLAAALITALISSRLPTGWSLPMLTLLLAIFFFLTTIAFDRLNLLLRFSSPALAMILTFLGVLIYRAINEEREKRYIRSTFGRYVSPKVVDQILTSIPELGGTDKEITVFFSDIRGFTSLSEDLPPQELVRHLNRYLDAMTEIILHFSGTLDKYVGDEIMCFWGAPLPQPEHALLACKTAVAQIEKLEALNKSWPPELQIRIGIGINSGIMTVGNMGSPGRLNYTLMGDNVNLGARLEGTNKIYGTRIIISESTYELVKDSVIARELDYIRVKGKHKPVTIYELVDII